MEVVEAEMFPAMLKILSGFSRWAEENHRYDLARDSIQIITSVKLEVEKIKESLKARGGYRLKRIN